MTKTCKAHTAQRRRRAGKYKDPQSSWTKTTKGWEYGRKVHMSLDAQNLLIQDWMTTTAAVHDSTMAKVQIDSGQGYKYFLADSAYDSQQIYRYIFDRSSMIPVIDTNKRKNVSLEKQCQARWLGVQLRQSEYFNLEYIWYVRNRNYDAVLGLAILAYNLCVMFNILNSRPHRKVADIIGCY
ncbi:transposase [Kosmotoga sp.]|uniref:transposase n=1 Tax=Kosmotoga sp. TaxID=1955248 RepID=UPI0024AB9BDE|nr:transposase [Kosmotoga sp.]MDI3523520.1 hypothetical protein [Kosmotoga sp.]